MAIQTNSAESIARKIVKVTVFQGPGCRVFVLLQVMEVLELPRGTALELLAEHGGDAQAVIMAVFGG